MSANNSQNPNFVKADILVVYTNTTEGAANILIDRIHETGKGLVCISCSEQEFIQRKSELTNNNHIIFFPCDFALEILPNKERTSLSEYISFVVSANKCFFHESKELICDFYSKSMTNRLPDRLGKRVDTLIEKSKWGKRLLALLGVCSDTLNWVTEKILFTPEKKTESAIEWTRYYKLVYSDALDNFIENHLDQFME